MCTCTVYQLYEKAAHKSLVPGTDRDIIMTYLNLGYQSTIYLTLTEF